METNKKNKKVLYLWGAVFFVLIVVGCIVWLVANKISSIEAENEYEELRSEVTSSIITTVSSVSISETSSTAEFIEEIPDVLQVDLSEYDFPEREIDFNKLNEETNKDIYAWIYIPDTGIDYPIVQHESDVDYYLNYNLDGKKGRPGCIYTEFYNSKDFTDFNTVIYGHNWVNGTMFSNLHYYEDSLFFDEHPYVYIFTPNGNLVYEVFAAYEFSNLHLLLGFNLNDPEIRDIYIDNIYASSSMKNNFNKEVEVTGDDRILSLSTCLNNGNSNKRYIVACKLVADGRVEFGVE